MKTPAYSGLLINMSNTPRTNEKEEHYACGTSMVVASFARELERELATESAINQRNCEDWAHDHTHLKNLCRKAGYDEHAVEGDSYGIRSITQLGDMLLAKIDDLNEERQNWRISSVARKIDSENKRLVESLKSVRELCTTDHESKERFIARVLLCLPNVCGDPRP